MQLCNAECPVSTTVGRRDFYTASLRTARRQRVTPPPLPTAERRVQFWSMFLKNWHVTITYCFVFWSFGMCVAFLGPTLGDLGE